MVFASRSRDQLTGKRKRPIWLPLRDKCTKQGAPVPPDSVEEISEHLQRKLRDCVHMADGAQANKVAHKAGSLVSQPLLTTNHSKK
eukprot:2261159-Amphidinium_carterae.1